MKTFSKLSLVALAIISSSVFTGCKKTDDDTNAPIITVNGNKTFFNQLGTSYTDAGASASDDVDGAIAVTTSGVGSVNVNAVGTYVITYTAKDKAGNLATSTRTVYVVDIAGTYSVVDTSPYPGGSTSNYTETATLSTTTNGKVNVLKFGNYVNGAASFNLTSGSALTMPSQNVTCGNPSANRNFVGSGSVQTVGGVTVLTIDYTETVGSSSVAARGVYTKQ
jgi:hypothetical protein